jgi:hypothetical protein
VLSSGPPAPESKRHSQYEAGPRLDFLSSNALHVTAAGSGHEIHLYQPDLAAKTSVRAVLANHWEPRHGVCFGNGLRFQVHRFAGCGGLAGCIENFRDDDVGFEGGQSVRLQAIEDDSAQIG